MRNDLIYDLHTYVGHKLNRLITSNNKIVKA